MFTYSLRYRLQYLLQVVNYKSCSIYVFLFLLHNLIVISNHTKISFETIGLRVIKKAPLIRNRTHASGKSQVLLTTTPLTLLHLPRVILFYISLMYLKTTQTLLSFPSFSCNSNPSNLSYILLHARAGGFGGFPPKCRSGSKSDH